MHEKTGTGSIEMVEIIVLEGMDYFLMTEPKKDYVLVDLSGGNWPAWAMQFRGQGSRFGRGYATAEEAERRAKVLRDRAAARGVSGPDLVIRERTTGPAYRCYR